MGVNLVVPGPEVPLVKGVTDHFKQCTTLSAAARLEGSKTFAKDFMAKYNIPTARYRNFSDYLEAKSYLDEVQHSIVIKATGLAAGKGVIIPQSKPAAQDALKRIMVEKEFKDAGNEVVIEEYLHGQELSFLTFCDGYTIRSLPAAQDHKQLNDGDCGPNTGGMGAYAPAPIANPELVDEIHRTVLQPTVDALRRSEAQPFVGLLFTGLMITSDGPKVLEYNVRFGDPETQALLPLISMDTDLAEIMIACTEGRLDGVQFSTRSGSSVAIVATAGGYPMSYKTGDTIKVDDSSALTENEYVFHAGTAFSDGSLVTAGGRVMAVTSTAESLQAALARAYDIMNTVEWPGKYYRKDIGWRASAPLAHNVPALPDLGLTYAAAGVSISAGNELVERIKTHVRSTARPGALGGLGGFGGVFDPARAGYSEVPLLVTGTDGVGTKLQIAQAINKHDTVGIDLVAMNVNDLIVQGAEPLFFTDVFSCSELDVSIAEDVIKGVCDGCKTAQCALIGGETAEMAGFFPPGRYDIVGTCSGAIRRDKRLLPDQGAMKEGDVLLGLASNGCHSNGFSLIRKIVERACLRYNDRAPWDKERTVGHSLLTPTRIYVEPVLVLVKKDLVKGMAHITGGGLWENTPRMLPPSLTAELDAAQWECPAVQKWLKRAGHVDDFEFARTFNTGLGMILVVDSSHADEAERELSDCGEKVFRVGQLTQRRDKGCIVQNTRRWNI
ncbi:MAG: hypothetical protein Q9219_002580 [cf. Caloplaca sp. 3 TL-2023]